MGVKLFNDLVTVLDVLPSSPQVDICVNHPSTCVISGKVRIMAKRPFVYKSLVVTATGTSRITRRNLQAQQLFLLASTEIVHQGQQQHQTPLSLSSPTTPTTVLPTTATAAATTRLTESSLSSQTTPSIVPTFLPGSSRDELPASIYSGDSVRRQSDENESMIISQAAQSRVVTTVGGTEPTLPVLSSSLDATESIGPSITATAATTQPQVTFSTNQLQAGVNDIDFRIEFPSHHKPYMMSNHDSNNNNNNNNNEVHQQSLPTGPIRTSSHSCLDYMLRTTLTLSRRDVLVNNQLSVTTPFRVQTWQDQIDASHCEEHAYHGQRRGKIEFEFQVPKQLDAKRLDELQLNFQGGWKVLDSRLKVEKVHYYLIEEECQTFVPRGRVDNHTSIISTMATYDNSASATPSNQWEYMQANEVVRLQVPQPSVVHQPFVLPGLQTVTVGHKLRVIIQFDKTHGNEKDLQLSFPISIHPTLEESGAPVHSHQPELAIRPHRRRRGRRAGRVGALYTNPNEGINRNGIHGVNGGDHDGDDADDDDDEILPLPMYGDREESLLLMVGEEVQELDHLDQEEMDALGISISTIHPNHNQIDSYHHHHHDHPHVSAISTEAGPSWTTTASGLHSPSDSISSTHFSGPLSPTFSSSPPAILATSTTTTTTDFIWDIYHSRGVIKQQWLWDYHDVYYS
ncbi:hypothetical protein BG004_001600 [Podila humilis]|nr:hypothetical protein BG004_001600 [Podila humilis]